MEVAGGVEYREEWLQTRPAEPLAQGAIIGASNFAPTEGRRTSWEVFAELHLPLLADLPALHRLDVFLLFANPHMTHHSAKLLRQAGLVEGGTTLALDVCSHSHQCGNSQYTGAANPGHHGIPGSLKRR